jgi:hypothetical protein
VRRLASIWPLTHQARLEVLLLNTRRKAADLRSTTTRYRQGSNLVEPRQGLCSGARKARARATSNARAEVQAIRGCAHGRTFGCRSRRAIADGRRPGPAKPMSFDEGDGGSGPGGSRKRDSRPVEGSCDRGRQRLGRDPAARSKTPPETGERRFGGSLIGAHRSEAGHGCSGDREAQFATKPKLAARRQTSSTRSRLRHGFGRAGGSGSSRPSESGGRR